MSQERSEFEEMGIPAEYSWSSLTKRLNQGTELTGHYKTVLEELAKEGGLLGLIFKDAQRRQLVLGAPSIQLMKKRSGTL
ncbi:MAG: hypothetical protein M3511_06945 [Deinococcota bacterium]|nr:hypothetical protein [Deinococcota bacterium]